MHLGTNHIFLFRIIYKGSVVYRSCIAVSLISKTQIQHKSNDNFTMNQSNICKFTQISVGQMEGMSYCSYIIMQRL